MLSKHVVCDRLVILRRHPRVVGRTSPCDPTDDSQFPYVGFDIVHYTATARRRNGRRVFSRELSVWESRQLNVWRASTPLSKGMSVVLRRWSL